MTRRIADRAFCVAGDAQRRVRRRRFNAVYLPLPAADVDDFVTFGRAIGLCGASVTIPFKVSLCDRMDEVYAVARRIGAINTVRALDGKWVGGNTDASGFLTPLKDRVSLRGTRVAVLGAGGSARAVVTALSASQAQVTVYARNPLRAQEIAEITSCATGSLPPEPIVGICWSTARRSACTRA